MIRFGLRPALWRYMEKYPTTAMAAIMKSRKSVWTTPATGSNRAIGVSRPASTPTSVTGHLHGLHLVRVCVARILSHLRKFVRGHIVEWRNFAAAFAIALDRGEKSTVSTVTSARPVLLGRRFSLAL